MSQFQTFTGCSIHQLFQFEIPMLKFQDTAKNDIQILDSQAVYVHFQKIYLVVYMFMLFGSQVISLLNNKTGLCQQACKNDQDTPIW